MSQQHPYRMKCQDETLTNSSSSFENSSVNQFRTAVVNFGAGRGNHHPPRRSSRFCPRAGIVLPGVMTKLALRPYDQHCPPARADEHFCHGGIGAAEE